MWNNGGFISIRDQQRGYFGQELATSFRYAASGAPYRCDFAATWDLPPLSYPEPGFGWPDP